MINRAEASDDMDRARAGVSPASRKTATEHLRLEGLKEPIFTAKGAGEVAPRQLWTRSVNHATGTALLLFANGIVWLPVLISMAFDVLPQWPDIDLDDDGSDADEAATPKDLALSA